MMTNTAVPDSYCLIQREYQMRQTELHMILVVMLASTLMSCNPQSMIMDGKTIVRVIMAFLLGSYPGPYSSLCV